MKYKIREVTGYLNFYGNKLTKKDLKIKERILQGC